MILATFGEIANRRRFSHGVTRRGSATGTVRRVVATLRRVGLTYVTRYHSTKGSDPLLWPPLSQIYLITSQCFLFRVFQSPGGSIYDIMVFFSLK